MRNALLIFTLLAATLVASALFSVAAAPLAAGQQPCDRMECADALVGMQDGEDDIFGGPGGRQLGRLARVLDLSATQQEQIRVLTTAHQSSCTPLRKELKANREQLRQLEQQAPFDEAAVRAVATKQAEIQSELIVARAKMHSQVTAILTPEQRKLAERLRPEAGERRGAGHGPRTGRAGK